MKRIVRGNDFEEMRHVRYTNGSNFVAYLYCKALLQKTIYALY